MLWWYWLVFGLVLLIAEVAVPGGLVMVFFGCAALIVGALAGLGFGGPTWFQWLCFAVLSVISLVFFRNQLLKRLRANAPNQNAVDSLVGEAVVLLEDIGAGGRGKVELRGTTWSAQSRSTEALRQGARCKVVEVNGLTLFFDK